MDKGLNENDKKLLAYCMDTDRTTRQVAEHLNIASKNVSVRLDKLEKRGLIVVRRKGKGKVTFIRTTEGIKEIPSRIAYLKAIKNKKGISYEELFEVLPLDISNPKNHDNWKVLTTLPYLSPSLVKQKTIYELTPEGEAYIKKFEKKK